MTPLTIVRLEVGVGLVVLLGLIWMLRGGRAALKSCAATGLAEMIAGLAVRSAWLICGSVIIFGFVVWAWRST